MWIADDWFILMYIRGCKFSIEKTKRKIDLLFTMKTMIPEIFSGWDPMKPSIQNALSYGYVKTLATTVYAIIKNNF